MGDDDIARNADAVDAMLRYFRKHDPFFGAVDTASGERLIEHWQKAHQHCDVLCDFLLEHGMKAILAEPELTRQLRGHLLVLMHADDTMSN